MRRGWPLPFASSNDRRALPRLVFPESDRDHCCCCCCCCLAKQRLCAPRWQSPLRSAAYTLNVVQSDLNMADVVSLSLSLFHCYCQSSNSGSFHGDDHSLRARGHITQTGAAVARSGRMWSTLAERRRTTIVSSLLALPCFTEPASRSSSSLCLWLHFSVESPRLLALFGIKCRAVGREKAATAPA